MSQPEIFHGYYDALVYGAMEVYAPYGSATAVRRHTVIQERKLSYRFYPHFHPYIGELVKRLIEKSVAGLEAADTEYRRKPDGTYQNLKNSDGTQATRADGTPKPRPLLHEPILSKAVYDPSAMVEHPYPVKDLDFTSSGAYSVYNWELFYHAPLLVAMNLSKNQRFEDAQRWFHYIFDPTDDSDGPTPDRFWKVKPFQYTDVKLIEEILVNLSTGADAALRQETINCIGKWKDAPFRPHVVARYRHSAYMFKAVMAYLDNLIDWGDMLFRQDTGESINEATQLYVLAANILGPRPQAVPKKGSLRPQTYANLRADLDKFGNAVRELEPDIPFDLMPHPGAASDVDRMASLRSLGCALYFCIPRNDKLLSYWDTVADRLYKIRNSLNIQGIFRQLPLFEPPIDPALLAKAAAAGLDVAAIVSGVNQPLPLVRFRVLLQKALEICQEVRSLGNSMLAAIEKEDNEALSILRARHEATILALVETVKYQQLQEAIKAREALEKSLVTASRRYTYYERLLGAEEGKIKIPELEALDFETLNTMKFQSSEPEIQPRPVPVDIVKEPSGEGEGRQLNTQERNELISLKSAHDSQESAAETEKLGSFLAIVPTFGARFEPFGAGGTIGFGGGNLAAAANLFAANAKSEGARSAYEAGKAAKIGAYARREQEWALQSTLAAADITHIYRQLRAAQIRENIARREWSNHQVQIRNAREIERFLAEEKNGKKTNQAFYAWMKRELKGLFGQCFQFAFDVARKAERALQHELGNSEISFLQFGYLAGKEGLLAGERLYLDLKRAEMAYNDLNQREYEMTRHVSMLQVNPEALLQLRSTGRCTLGLNEALFDFDCPGHYFRRIKSVAVSIPGVTGPYTSINCTLTLLKSSIRKSSLLRDGNYERESAEDDRFSDYFGSLQAVVTSTGQNDSGMFETNLRDERYLPFEYAGAVSEWQLELPSDVRQFDYDTISDVILHIRYTAREGGGLLRKGASDALTRMIDDARATGSVRLFSVRHEFPSEWAKFKAVEIKDAVKTAELALTLREQHYPFWSKKRLGVIKRVVVYAKNAGAGTNIAENSDGTGGKEPLVDDPALKSIQSVTLKTQPAPLGNWSLWFTNNSMKDLWVALTWGKQ